MAASGLKSYGTCVNILCDSILKKFLTHDTLDTSNIKLNLKSDISYVDTSYNSTIRDFFNYDTIIAADSELLTKSDKATTYLNYDVDVCFVCEFYKLE